MAALAVVLNFLKVDLGPEGGSINLVFIPLMVYALRWGCPAGMAVGFVFGILKAIIGGGIAYGWQSLLLDYSVAYAMVGLAGLFPEKPVMSSVPGALGCLASFVLSGVLVWGDWLPESFWGMKMTNIWVYSILYNGSFVAIDEIIAAIAISALGRKGLLLRQDSDKTAQ